MERAYFTFFKSFYDAINMLTDKAVQADAYRVLCEYALTGEEPDLSGVSDVVAAIFVMARPNIDTSRKKAESGKAGGKASQSEADASENEANESNDEANRSKPQANASKPEANASKPQANRSKSKKPASEIGDRSKEIGDRKKELGVEVGAGSREREYEVEGADALPPVLRKAVAEWLAYKRERREAYKPTGLKSLMTQIERACALHGPEAVAELIHDCMASGYRGITFDRLERRSRDKPSSNPFLDMLQEEAAR